MGFKIISRQDAPFKFAIFGRDDKQMGIAENGGDHGNDGCFIEVGNISMARDEL